MSAAAFASPGGDNNTAKYTPIEFIPNHGQWQGNFLYNATVGPNNIILLQNGILYTIGAKDNFDKMDAYHHGTLKTPPTLSFHSYKVTFVGANKATVTGSRQEEFYCNYFLGKDPARWKTNIHPYLAVDYANLYNNINMHLSSFNGILKYEFVVNKGAHASDIQMQYDGQSNISVKYGSLYVGTTVGNIIEIKPYTYQYINDTRVAVNCEYKLTNNTLSFSFPDGYDTTQTLIIDPTVVFATFSGSTADNWGFTATYDEHGNFYNGGIVHKFTTTNDFIETTGAFQTTYKGGDAVTGSLWADDIGIVKYNTSGSTRIWATYLGGTSNEQPHSMIVDSSDNLVIAGRTYSRDFPVTATAYDTSQNGSADIIVTKLRSDGAALLGSTYIGGSGDDGVNFDAQEFVFGNLKYNYGDDARSEVVLDKQGNVYVTAATLSTNFPTTASAYKATNSGQQDGVVFKFNSNLTSLLWSTYIGGSNDDAGYVLAFDTNQQHLYVSGSTMSSDFPSTTGTLHTTFQGNIDGFILKFLNTAPYTLQKGTFIGTADPDQCYGIQIDFDNKVYVMGQSIGGHFPVVGTVYSNPHSSQFVMALDSNLNNVIFSTVYGSGDSTHTNISPVAFLVDTCGNIYISGWGGKVSIDPTIPYPASIGTCTNMPVTADAAQATTDGRDFYFIAFGRNAASLLYGTFMGGVDATSDASEHVDGGTSRFDKNGIVYQAICGGCGGRSVFPTTVGAWSTTNKSANCNEIALKIAFELGDVVAKAKASPNAKGCLPFTVKFLDSSINAKTFAWDFGDGSTDTAKFPTHTFTSAGTFRVRLVINNPKACKVLDTAYLNIYVDTTYEHPSFTSAVQDSCGPYVASFTNTSVYSPTPGSSTFTKFIWLFGDGNSYNGTTPPTHTYAGPGVYTVSLVMIDTTACNSPDTVKSIVRLNSSFVKAGFNGPDSVCQGAAASFTDSSSNGTTYHWDFGDGGTSGTSPTTHIFDTTGIYTITYIVGNPTSCNGADTIVKQIKVLGLPVADFTFSPLVPQTNVPTTFTNLSVNADRYLWDFGDGATTADVNPSHFYKRTGDYKVCLTAKNSSNCPSTACKTVSADVHPLADIPTAFSPNGDGKNDILFVRGAAVQTMDVKIFNRWGEKVFETTDMNKGWDGTFNGQPQPVDAYAFILNVTFIDGTTLEKKGNITLLR